MSQRQAIADYAKMSAIFIAFDRDGDGLLDKNELTQLIKQCNPSVELTSLQLNAIVHEVQLSNVHCDLAVLHSQNHLYVQVLLEYEGSSDASGLSRQGLVQLYLSSSANSDADFYTLNLTVETEQHGKVC